MIRDSDTAMIRDSDTGLTRLPAITLLHMSVEQIQSDQESDPLLKPIIQYLTNGDLPRSQKLARKILLQQSDFVIVENLLFHSRVSKSKRTKLLSQYQLVVPESFVPAVLNLYHDTPLAAHGGIQDTIDRIREHYFFHNLASIVADYVRSCHACQSRKVTNLHQKNTTVAYPTLRAPFLVWQIDLYVPCHLHQEPMHTFSLQFVCFLSYCLLSQYDIRMP